MLAPDGRAASARNSFRAPRRFQIYSLPRWVFGPHIAPFAMALLSKGSACQPAPTASVACDTVRKWQLPLGNLALHEQMPMSSHLHFVMGWWSSNNTRNTLLQQSFKGKNRCFPRLFPACSSSAPEQFEQDRVSPSISATAQPGTPQDAPSASIRALHIHSPCQFHWLMEMLVHILCIVLHGCHL